MTIEEILDHESQSVGRIATYYAHKVIEYVAKTGRREQIWTVVYEVDTPQVLVDLGGPAVHKRWVIHDTGTKTWTGGICG